ncbi:MAG TPA: DUF6580 family putative transport protein [Bryobacteraceae bacterium]|jgi:hypothetical protein
MQDKRPSFQPLALGLTIAAALLRLVPHPYNFTPVGGIALFGGARLKGWQAYVIPLLAMLITDPILSSMAGYPMYSPATLIIYFSFLIYVVLGRFLIGNSTNPLRIGAVALAGSVQFFLITNLFVWMGDKTYPHTLAGLASCYVAALPFFSRTLVGDLFYAGVLFTAYALAERKLEPAEKRS